jgi:hypothetical protein
MGDWCGSISRKPTRRNNRCKPGIKAVMAVMKITGKSSQGKRKLFSRGGVFFLDWPFNG